MYLQRYDQKVYNSRTKDCGYNGYTRSNKLYQNGVAIADIVGPVQNNDGTVTFTQIANVLGLDRNQPIEYNRLKLKVIQIQSIIGMKSVVSDSGSSILQNVMEGVICEKLE